MNHEIIIETEVDGAEPYADLLRQVIPAALAAEHHSFTTSASTAPVLWV